MPKVRYIGHNPVKLSFRGVTMKIKKNEEINIDDKNDELGWSILLKLSSFELIKEDKEQKDTKEV